MEGWLLHRWQALLGLRWLHRGLAFRAARGRRRLGELLCAIAQGLLGCSRQCRCLEGLIWGVVATGGSGALHASHEAAGVGGFAVEGGSTEVKARVLHSQDMMWQRTEAIKGPASLFLCSLRMGRCPTASCSPPLSGTSPASTSSAPPAG